MFDYVKSYIPDELKRLTIFNYDILSYKTCSSEVFHISKGNTAQFGINALSFDGLKLWNKFILNSLRNQFRKI